MDQDSYPEGIERFNPPWLEDEYIEEETENEEECEEEDEDLLAVILR